MRRQWLSCELEFMSCHLHGLELCFGTAGPRPDLVIRSFRCTAFPQTQNFGVIQAQFSKKQLTLQPDSTDDRTETGHDWSLQQRDLLEDPGGNKDDQIAAGDIEGTWVHYRRNG